MKRPNDMNWSRRDFSPRARLDIVAHAIVIKNGDGTYTGVCGGKRIVAMQATCENWHEAMKVAASRCVPVSRSRRKKRLNNV